MRRPSTSDLAIGLGAVSLAGAITVLESSGPPELLYYSVLFAVIAVLGRLTLKAARLTIGQRRLAVELAGVHPADAALAAVREERLRLTADIADSLREALLRIRTEVEAASVGPGLESRLRRIHDTTQHATSELRRHLGLLRTPFPPGDGPGPDEAEPRLPRRDLVLAAGMVPLAIVESIAYPLTEQMESWSALSVLTTAVASATVIGRTVALGPAALACGTAFAVGSLVGAPVVDGFWLLGSVGVLVWSVLARPGIRPLELGSAAQLATAVIVTREIDSKDNVVVAGMILLVAAVAGLVFRLIRSSGDAAAVRSDELEQDLRTATATAVGAERITFARELHDVVSHAVGLIAMQAAAAEVSWSRDRPVALQALSTIRDTAGDRSPTWTVSVPATPHLGTPAGRPAGAGGAGRGRRHRSRTTAEARRVRCSPAGRLPHGAGVTDQRAAPRSRGSRPGHRPAAGATTPGST